MLEVGVVGQQEKRPAGQAAEDVGHGPVEFLHIALIADAFAIGRVGDQAGVVSFAGQCEEIALLEVDVVGDARFFGMEAGEGNLFGVDIAGENSLGQIRADLRFGVGAGGSPERGVHGGPSFDREGAVQARRDIAAYQGGFDGDRATATKRVDQRAVGFPDTQLHQGSGEGFFQWRDAHKRAVASFVQARACRIEREGGDVVEQGYFDLAERACFGQLVDTVSFAEGIDEGFFHAALAGGHGGELRFDASASHGEGAFRADPLFPGQRRDAVEQLVEVAGIEAAYLEEDPLGAAQPNVGTEDVSYGPGKGDSAVADDFGFVAQVPQFPRDDRFQACCRGRQQRERFLCRFGHLFGHDGRCGFGCFFGRGFRRFFGRGIRGGH